MYSIYNVVQMSDEILRVLHCSNILIYNILYWQIKARQTISFTVSEYPEYLKIAIIR
jgi:hypothetical protein